MMMTLTGREEGNQSAQELRLQVDMLKSAYASLLEHSTQLDQEKQRLQGLLDTYRKNRGIRPAPEPKAADSQHPQRRESEGGRKQHEGGPFPGCGWLVKQGGFRKNWKKRWFRTEETALGLTLKYFEDPEAFQALGTIPLGTVSRVELSSAGAAMELPSDTEGHSALFHVHTIGGRVYNLLAPSGELRASWVAFVTEATGAKERARQQEQERERAREREREESPPPAKSYEELFEDCAMLRQEYNSLLRAAKEIEDERCSAAEALARERAKGSELENRVHFREAELDSCQLLLQTFRAEVASLTVEREHHIQRIRRSLIHEASQEDALSELKKQASMALSDMAGTSAPEVLVHRMEAFGIDCFAVPLHHIRSLEQKRSLLRCAERTHSPNLIMYVLLFLDANLTQPALFNELAGSPQNTLALYERYLRRSKRKAQLHDLKAYLYRVGSVSDREWALYLLQRMVGPDLSDPKRVSLWEQVTKMDLQADPLLAAALLQFKKVLPVSYLISINDPSVSIPAVSSSSGSMAINVPLPEVEELKLDPLPPKKPRKKPNRLFPWLNT